MKSSIILGDVRQQALNLPDNYFQCIVTSPPYFGHRIYSGNDPNEIGRETSPSLYIEHLVESFNVLRSKLHDNGLLWLNLGDTYKEKTLLGMPWRVALALQEKGWILRSDIIWHKPNAMPSSVKDRPTVDHEYIFMFSKNAEYYYDADAIREPHVTFSEKSKMRGGRNHFGKRNGTPENGKNSGNHNLHDGRWDQAFNPNGRNKRTVWEIPLGKFRDTHFAVFPEKLVENCILASTKTSDFILDPFCGSGTTGVVSIKHDRNFVGIELVKKYQIMAQTRITELTTQTSLFDLSEVS
ncbi:MAG: site-specific DNA-methyltransferase [Spirochaetaceae bacterium]|jgi:site-specific DNA-methyltransferase (adenine-specific)|nr:site-specific DNA-methyltransferase [Spirochaetaceae bacterium]